MKPREQIFVEWLNGQNITSLGQRYKRSRLRIQQIVRKVARGLYVQRGQELAAEREACAAICDKKSQESAAELQFADPEDYHFCKGASAAWLDAAAVIRARGGE